MTVKQDRIAAIQELLQDLTCTTELVGDDGEPMSEAEADEIRAKAFCVINLLSQRFSRKDIDDGMLYFQKLYLRVTGWVEHDPKTVPESTRTMGAWKGSVAPSSLWTFPGEDLWRQFEDAFSIACQRDQRIRQEENREKLARRDAATVAAPVSTQRKVKRRRRVDTSTWLTLQEAADLLQATPQTIRNYVISDRLTVKVARRKDANGVSRKTVVYNPSDLRNLTRR